MIKIRPWILLCTAAHQESRGIMIAISNTLQLSNYRIHLCNYQKCMTFALNMSPSNKGDMEQQRIIWCIHIQAEVLKDCKKILRKAALTSLTPHSPKELVSLVIWGIFKEYDSETKMYTVSVYKHRALTTVFVY